MRCINVSLSIPVELCEVFCKSSLFLCHWVSAFINIDNTNRTLLKCLNVKEPAFFEPILSTNVVSSLFIEHRFLWILLWSGSMKLIIHWSLEPTTMICVGKEPLCQSIYMSSKHWSPWIFIKPQSPMH